MKLYVGNLPDSVDGAKLKELFSSFGEIEGAMVIQNRLSGRSKGLKFMTFENEGDAEKYITENL